MPKRLAVILGVFIFLAGLPAGAEECPTHRVRAGDTLRKIAEHYLGSRDLSEKIHAANRSRIGPNADLIEPGMVLAIPCAQMLEPAVEAKPAQTTPVRAVALTGGPFSPFSGPDLPASGLITELVGAAYAKVPDAQVEVLMVNDLPAHLSTLLPRGGYSISFPWVYPDCEAGSLIPAERALCDGFVASDSLFELVTEFYARADSTWASAVLPTDLAGSRLCRPSGYPTTDLVRMGLLPGSITLIVAIDPQDCLRMVDDGTADIASLDSMVTRALVMQMDLSNPLIVLEPLSRFERLRALAIKGDAEGEAAIAALNSGIEALGSSGEWYDIVQRHLNGPGG